MTKLTIFSKLGTLALFCLCVSCTQFTPIERAMTPTMTVTAGPEQVFDRPLGEILPELENAMPTGNNGRVGNEMVFWSYQLQDNRQVNFFGCAVLDDVDCEERIQAICPAGGQEITRAVEPGGVRHMYCRAIGVVGAGDLHPACQDNTRESDVLVGLVQCQ